MKRNSLFRFIILLISLMLLVSVGCTANNSTDNTDTSDGTEQSGPSGGEQDVEEITELYITINRTKMKVTLAQNSSVNALVELLKQGDITYTANDYGGFEKVGSLGHTLPTNHVQTVTEPGDIVLYQTNQIVMFYGSNSWSYTRIGKLNYSSQSELESFLDAGSGSVQVTISLK